MKPTLIAHDKAIWGPGICTLCGRGTQPVRMYWLKPTDPRRKQSLISACGPCALKHGNTP